MSEYRQHDLFKPTSSWKPPAELPTHLLKRAVFALDTETCDPNLTVLGPSWFRGGGFVVGFSLAWDGGSCYLPIRHGGGDNLNPKQVLTFMRDLLANYTGTIALMNGLYDLGWCRAEGLYVNPAATLRDVMYQEALLDEHKLRYNLNSIALTYKLPPKDENMLTEAARTHGCDPKAELWRLPARYVGPYAERDAELTLQCYHKQQPLLKLNGLAKVVELEHDLVPLLLEMRWRGVRVDCDKAEQTKQEFMAEYQAHLASLKHLTGYRLDVWSADSCAVALDAAGIRYGKTATGKPNLTDDFLAKHPEVVPNLISKARKAYKAGSTFCQGMVLDHADGAGRLHCEFHPLRSDDGGTVSGRFSCSAPNLQQIPGRDPVMFTKLRGLFLPEEGEQWAASDWSQQEPRLTLHYAYVNNCSRAAEAVDLYNADPNTDYHNFVATLVFGKNFNKKERQVAKTINLGLAYGMGGAKLCQQLGLPT